MLVRPVQPEKAPLAMSVTLSGIEIVFNLLQFANEFVPIESKEVGRFTEIRLVQLKKAPFPILVTLLGTEMFVIPERLKASEEMVITELGRVTSEREEHWLKMPLGIFVRPLGKVTFVRLKATLKILEPNSSTLLGIFIEVSLKSCEKALLPIRVTLEGIFMLSRFGTP